jgi:hypothetical protein
VEPPLLWTAGRPLEEGAVAVVVVAPEAAVEPAAANLLEGVPAAPKAELAGAEFRSLHWVPQDLNSWAEAWAGFVSERRRL